MYVIVVDTPSPTPTLCPPDIYHMISIPRLSCFSPLLRFRVIQYNGKLLREKTSKQIGEKYDFRRLLAFATSKNAMPLISQRKLRVQPQNHKICESFLPRKFSAIRYAEHKPKNKKDGGLGTRLVFMYVLQAILLGKLLWSQ